VTDYIALETKPIVAEYRTTTKSVLPARKCCILPLGLYCVYRYVLEDTAYAVLSRDMVSMNYLNLIKFIKVVFDKIGIL
jgi:hypothetical protein